MATRDHQWKFFKAGGAVQVCLNNGADLESLEHLDQKLWTALSCPSKGLRFDQKTLDFLDADHDGRIRVPEVLAALKWTREQLGEAGLDALFAADEKDAAQLADVTARQAALDKEAPSAADLAALKAWENAPAQDAAILPFGEATAATNDALAAVEGVLDAFFAVPEDAPLMSEEPDKVLKLSGNLNPKWSAALSTFAAAALPAGTTEISRAAWTAAKAQLAPYRAWIASKPVMAADAKGRLETEEKLLRYKLHLVDFLRNFVNLAHLYNPETSPIFRIGTLYIDARAVRLCFEVKDLGAFSKIAADSKCCLVYCSIKRPGENAARTICGAVTAGLASTLWIGRNGVFYDRDGNDWEATVVKVDEHDISLREAFWSPWRKIAAMISNQINKLLASKQDAALAGAAAKVEDTSAGNPPKKMDGAALASSVAALGIAVGMVGTAVGALVSAIAGIPLWKTLLGVLAVILAISLPSMLIAWFKLRARDLAPILNAGDWAINRSLNFSFKLAKLWTPTAKLPAKSSVSHSDPFADRHTGRWILLALILLAGMGLALFAAWRHDLLNGVLPEEYRHTQPAPAICSPASTCEAAAPCR